MTESGSKFRSDGGDPGSKTVYILLPYYQRGNLQDAINANLVNHTKFPEKKLIVLMVGVARALKAMHQYKVKGGANTNKRGKRSRRTAAEESEDTAARMGGRRTGKNRNDDDTEQEPLMDGELSRNQEGVDEGDFRPYAHRDIKPGIFTLHGASHFSKADSMCV